MSKKINEYTKIKIMSKHLGIKSFFIFKEHFISLLHKP